MKGTKLLLALLRVHQEFIIESSRRELRYSECNRVTWRTGLINCRFLGDADTRKRKKNARYKKGTKPEKRELTCGSAVYRI